MLTTPDLLTSQFYDWERRGRGWQLYDAPVVLEPPFRPFHRYNPFAPSLRPRDDGRKETISSSLVSFFKSLVSATPPPAPRLYPEEEERVTCDSEQGAPRSELAIVLPADEDVEREAAEQLLLSLSTCPSPVSFEIIGTSEAISIQLSCRETEAMPVA